MSSVKRATLSFSLAVLVTVLGAFIAPTGASAGHYDLEDIELVPDEVRTRLAGEGVTNTSQLLEQVVSAGGRDRLVKNTGLDPAAIANLARMLELMQLDGVGPKAATLLIESGVASVADLAAREPGDLLERLVLTNADRQITGVDPDLAVVTDWIARAATAAVQLQP